MVHGYDINVIVALQRENAIAAHVFAQHGKADPVCYDMDVMGTLAYVYRASRVWGPSAMTWMSWSALAPVASRGNIRTAEVTPKTPTFSHTMTWMPWLLSAQPNAIPLVSKDKAK